MKFFPLFKQVQLKTEKIEKKKNERRF